MICDVVKCARKLYIVGYGHVGKAIGELLYKAGYSIHIFDREKK